MAEPIEQVNQHAIARRIGVTPSVVSKWMHGKRLPRRKNLVALAQELGRPVDDLNAELRSLRGEIPARTLKPNSQVNLARRLGVTQVTISRWLTGAYLPGPKNLERLAVELGQDPVALFSELHARKTRREKKFKNT